MTVLLTLTTTHSPATDLALLLEKPLDDTQTFPLEWGNAHVFYPERTDDRCTAALLVEVDPNRLAKQAEKHGGAGSSLAHHVDDRSYTASALLGGAIPKVLSSAMRGTSSARQELADRAIPLIARLPVVACRGGRKHLEAMFAPLGYRITLEAIANDPRLGQPSASSLFRVTLEADVRLADLLTQLCALIPMLDEERADEGEARLERSLDGRRRQAVLGALLDAKATRVLDLGCGGGELLHALANDNAFERVIGCDVSPRALDRAASRLNLEAMPEAKRARVELIHGSALYRDPRFGEVDAICLVEVIEHIDPQRLGQLARVVFGSAQPRTVIVTTPNRGRAELAQWCDAISLEHGYSAQLHAIGEDDPEVGPPTQMAVFTREEGAR